MAGDDDLDPFVWTKKFIEGKQKAVEAQVDEIVPDPDIPDYITRPLRAFVASPDLVKSISSANTTSASFR